MVHAAVRGSHHARVRICSELFGASLLAGISWGGMASTMFVPLFAGLFWPGATRAGALASAIGGDTSSNHTSGSVRGVCSIEEHCCEKMKWLHLLRSGALRD